MEALHLLTLPLLQQWQKVVKHVVDIVYATAEPRFDAVYATAELSNQSLALPLHFKSNALIYLVFLHTSPIADRVVL